MKQQKTIISQKINTCQLVPCFKGSSKLLQPLITLINLPLKTSTNLYLFIFKKNNHTWHNSFLFFIYKYLSIFCILKAFLYCSISII
ncbi:hypothetical protein K501DRAFT_13029 [Backusella circina FSU 941]|nr:hypothetical protein K501DRAFT_13029 [Backusella circina FSU 941]